MIRTAMFIQPSGPGVSVGGLHVGSSLNMFQDLVLTSHKNRLDLKVNPLIRR